MSAITFTDTTTGKTSGLIDTSEIVETLGPWYPDAPQDVTDSLAEMQRLMLAGDWNAANAHVEYLALEARRPSRVDVLGIVEDAAAALEQAQTALEAAQAARDDAVRLAFREGLSGPLIARAAGLTTARTYQVRDGKR